MKKLPIILLGLGAIISIVSFFFKGYADGSGKDITTTPFIIIGVILMVLGLYLKFKLEKSNGNGQR